MRNLFNNISQEEKSRILEMHSGKKNVISEQEGLPTETPEQKEFKKLRHQLYKKYGCRNTSDKFDPMVQKYQILRNKIYGRGKEILKPDGIIGPLTTSDLCPA
jgi:hypothetical protein